ncbi:MAG: Mrp/NBP35 family ATP-binding protein [Alphaproteobacteria bacterium]|nr:Mrp/NBP35 family ATP-binding protein [Alphaproteobacteria bacterium]
MNQVTTERVIGELRRIKGPDLKEDIITLGLVSDIVVRGGNVCFSISVNPARAAQLEPMRQAAEQVVGSMEGVTRAIVTLTAHSGGEHASHQRPQEARKSSELIGLSHIKHIIAVASGKGGVGKSTVAVNLALAFRAVGLKTGILDADIYGPSMPHLLGLTGTPVLSDTNTFIPLEGHGLKVMSIGFLIDPDQAAIWRGPMIISALTRMLRDVQWGELDILIIDMPPGTGDAQLTLAQKVSLSGALIISTPQDLALLDVRKAIQMFRRLEVPLLGLVENMSYFLCPHCKVRTDIFGRDGGRKEAERIGIKFIGQIPLEMVIREQSDAGNPVTISMPDSHYAGMYRTIAAKVFSQLEDTEGG